MKQTYTTGWQGGLAFSTRFGDHVVRSEATPEHGGSGSAPSPKPLMVAALAGCTGIDVVSTLKKMKVVFDDLSIDIEADASEDQPSTYTAMHLVYRFKGKNLDHKKLQRAVDLSQEKYCGVSAMYKKMMDVTYEIQIE